jgi:hypothetical protein
MIYIILLLIGLIIFVLTTYSNNELFNNTELSPPKNIIDNSIKIINYPPIQQESIIKTKQYYDGDVLEVPWAKNPKNYGEVADMLNDGSDGFAGLNYNLCSKSCCSQQYPPPFMTSFDNFVCNSKDKFVPSNYVCNNGYQDTGCLCITEKQQQFLQNRGGNVN